MNKNSLRLPLRQKLLLPHTYRLCFIKLCCSFFVSIYQLVSLFLLMISCYALVCQISLIAIICLYLFLIKYQYSLPLLLLLYHIRELGTAMPYGCNDNIKGVGYLSSPGW